MRTFFRVLSALVLGTVLLSAPAYAQLDPMLMMATGGSNFARPYITGVTVAGSTSVSFTSTSGETNPVNLGTAAATASDGSMPSLTVGTGTGCNSTNNSYFSLSSGSLLFTDPTPGSAGGPWYGCLVAAGAYSNSPYAQTITVISTSTLTPPPGATAGCSPSNAGYNGTGNGGLSNGSCFNTLALNLDFTGTTQSFVAGGTPFNAQTLSNWLDCAGASSPVMYTAQNGLGGAPCTGMGGAFNIVNDGGTDALLMSYLPGMVSGGLAYLTMTSVNGSRSGGWAFPYQFYMEAKIRSDPGSDAIASGTLGGNTPTRDYWVWSAYSGSAYIESDIGEWYGGPTDDKAGSNIGTSPFMGTTQEDWSLASGYNHDNYQIIGYRITEATANTIAWCFYLNNMQVNTETYSSTVGNCAARSDSYVQPNTVPIELVLWTGTNGQSFSGSMNIYVEWIRVWECSNWQQALIGNANNGFACAGAVMTTNP